MKIRVILSFFALLLVVVAWRQLHRTEENELNARMATVPTLSEKSPTQNGESRKNSDGSEGSVAPLIGEASTGLQLQWEETMRKAYETPMDFVGVVLDEHARPIPEVQVRFSWNPIQGGTQNVTAISDESGRFSLDGRKGITLFVDVTKEGYYQIQGAEGSRRHFDFYAPSGSVRYTADLSQPAIFRLRKMGVGVPLLHRRLVTELPADGTIQIDIIAGGLSASGDFIFTLKRSRQDEPFAWEAKAMIKGGGLVKADGPFPFEAPESGYQEEISWSFPLNSQGRQRHLDFEETYFVTFGSPRRYARVRLWPKADTRALIFESFINPTGGRNLEAKPEPRSALPTPTPNDP